MKANASTLTKLRVRVGKGETLVGNLEVKEQVPATGTSMTSAEAKMNAKAELQKAETMIDGEGENKCIGEEEVNERIEGMRKLGNEMLLEF